jgi:secreted PhoX family phosphatase
VKTNVCAVSGLANPDNITFIRGYDTLVIGEDSTEGHQNDALWAYDLKSKELTRIFSSPYGAEVTGSYWYPNLNGFGYLKLQVQHPYGETDVEKAPDAQARQSYTGYLGPFPAMD